MTQSEPLETPSELDEILRTNFDYWVIGCLKKSYEQSIDVAKTAIERLIAEEVMKARIDELSQLLDEGEGGYPDGCEAVHLHSIEDRIAQLTQSNKEATQ